MGMVFLVGARGAGKTTVGRLLAGRLGCRFADTDHEIAAHCGKSVAEIVGLEGWAGFRAREGATLRRLARAIGAGRAVIATGGGMVLFRANREYMRRSGLVVWLDAPAEILLARVLADADYAQRPPLGGKAPAEEMACVLAERAPLYANAAHFRLDAEAGAQDIAREIHERLRAGPPAPLTRRW